MAAIGFDRAAWLVIARGGWWRPMEIVEQLPLDLDIAPDATYSRLWIMAQRHRTLRRRKPETGRAKRGPEARISEYAVTPDCLVPRGLSLREILAAVGAQPRS